MSTTKSEHYSKKIEALIEPEWSEFLHDVATEIALGTANIPLTLSIPLTITLLHTLLKEKLSTVSVLLPDQLKREIPPLWHGITDTLTDQELDGTISTSLSTAYHAAYYGAPHTYVAYIESLQDTKVPSSVAYQQSIIHIAAGQRMNISDLSAQLVGMGYTRFTKQTREGGFWVQGDTVSLRHPLFSYTVKIEFFGGNIDRILEDHDRKSTSISSIRIPPLAFPTETMLLSEVWKTIPTIIPNSPAALIELPEKIRAARLPAYTATTHKPSATQRSPIARERALELIGQLTPGKPAVHADHGIGIFEGLETRIINDIESEYIVLRYADGDSIAVPVPFAHKVSPYIGETSPPLYRLSGTLWQKTKKKAQADAAAFAKELLEITKQREHALRPSYYIDPALEHSLQDSFGFDLTPDQKTVWEEVTQDMQAQHPMDRLIVGDVGFGKTELAIRAAMHAFANGKQVAVLAPTTLLVQQHVDTFRTRLPNIAESIFLVSRFSSREEVRKAKAVLQEGKPAIIIGTHALLSHAIPWTNLSLLIIDEEQRFGVKQKEHLKKMRAHIDILSLSATPIPRTLSMALSGMRSLSIITTAPQGRKDIETVVKKETDAVLKEAIEKELSRNGQVYLVSPKIRNLSMIQEVVASLFPTARTAIAHAKLPDETLSEIIHAFDTREIDILISSSIVENGLDLPNVNTMIVWNAPHFGLGQLYQLRGRIGRRSRQGYAYFLYRQEKLTPIQKMRLTALTEASRVGSGWDIARKDLEMRGAGTMLGAKQSGSANEVGMQLYVDMVDGLAEVQKAEIRIVLPSFIPHTYIDNPNDRTAWYIKLSRSNTLEELAQKRAALEEAYGPLPEETENVIRIISLEILATALHITKISTRTISPSDEDPYIRIECETTKPVEALKKVSSMKNTDGSPARWQARNTTLFWDTDALTPSLVDALISSLQS